MGFLDKAQAKVKEVAEAAQDGIADQQAKRKADGLFVELGKWTYAKHKGSFENADGNIARLLGELAAHEAEHGEFGAKKEDAPPPPPPPPPPAAPPPPPAAPIATDPIVPPPVPEPPAPPAPPIPGPDPAPPPAPPPQPVPPGPQPPVPPAPPAPGDPIPPPPPST